MNDPIHIQMVSFPHFDGYMTECCSASIISSNNVEWTKDGLEVEKNLPSKCLGCNKENPKMIPWIEKKKDNENK